MLMLGVLMPVSVNRTIGMAMLVLMLHVFVRMRMSDSAGMLVLVRMPLGRVCLRFHGNLYSMYSD
jgi:hypothetical protein